jgi:hypothetical protein
MHDPKPQNEEAHCVLLLLLLSALSSASRRNSNVKDFGGCDQANTKMTLQIITQSERKMK